MKTAGGANALAWLFARGPRPCNTLQFSRGWDLLVPTRREGGLKQVATHVSKIK